MWRGRIFTFLRSELVPGAAAAVRGRPRNAALAISPDKYIDIEEPEDESPGGNEADPTYIGAQNTQGPEVTLVEERDDDYKEFRDKLIDAYDILFKQNQISWLH